MSDLTYEEKQRALTLAADALDYAWTSTEKQEHAEAAELGAERQFEWFREGYLAARDELYELAGRMGQYARGEVREVNGL